MVDFGRTKWDKRFLKLAEHIATWSRDPSTKVGAVIANDLNIAIGLGYNGFPRGVSDSPRFYDDRETKLKLVVHAEANAILNATTQVRGCTIYTTHFSCNECAKLVIQSGIKRIVSHKTDMNSKWLNAWAIAEDMYKSANIGITIYEK